LVEFPQVEVQFDHCVAKQNRDRFFLVILGAGS